MIVDKSAIISILTLDDDARRFANAIQESDSVYISAVNFFEVSAYVENKFKDVGVRELDVFFKKADIKVYDVDENIVDIARDAYRFYGKPKNPDGGLAFGDCFAYATAKYLNEPLLYKGDHFKNTDVVAAV
jgi:ribonuclease VapC